MAEHKELFIWAIRMPDLENCDVNDIIDWMEERPRLDYGEA